jgi:hypothetical protein
VLLSTQIIMKRDGAGCGDARFDCWQVWFGPPAPSPRSTTTGTSGALLSSDDFRVEGTAQDMRRGRPG